MIQTTTCPKWSRPEFIKMNQPQALVKLSRSEFETYLLVKSIHSTNKTLLADFRDPMKNIGQGLRPLWAELHKAPFLYLNSRQKKTNRY